MINNYLKIAWRNLIRNKNYSVINILGLAVGLACFMLIMLYVQDELGYDDFHENGDQIYRMALERKYPGRSRHYAIIPHSFAEVLESDFSEVEAVCRLFYFQGNNQIYKVDDVVYEEEYLMWADSNFFDMFSIKLLAGDPKTALTQPNSVVLTESIAKKIFGSADPLGKILEIDGNQDDWQVTGVCENVPLKSHLRFNMLGTSASLGQFLNQPNFLNFSAYTYLRLREGSDVRALESKFPDLVKKYASGQVLTQLGLDYADYQAQGNGYRYFLQPITDIYLKSNLEAELKPPGSMSRIYFFSAIAVIILIIACINFMNLATARSGSRSREVGIRKTLGSDRSQIAGQFLVEALLITTSAAAIAWCINLIALDPFNQLANKSLTSADLLNPKYLLILFGATVLTGLLSGAYPALSLSSFKPLAVMQGDFMGKTKGAGLRNVLVVFQFAVSVFLIIASIFVYKQWMFTQNKPLGFEKESLLTIEGTGGFEIQEEETFKKELAKLTGVEAVSGCSTQPGSQYFGLSFRAQGAQEVTTGSGIMVDEGYVECMKMDMVAGRSFSEAFMDTASLVINETAVNELGLDDPVGKILTSSDDFLNPEEGIRAAYTVVGVVKDFHFQSLHHPITPLFLIHNQKNFNAGVDPLITVRFSTDDYRQTLSEIGVLWSRFRPEVPLRYAFLDQDWANLYDKEITTRRISGLFTLIAIFIACLGLLALAAFTAEKRTKEIGIRKVLGASVPNLVTMLSLDFLKLVLIGILIAIPLSYYAIDRWLEQFAYRINISWSIFFLAALIAIAIAFLTVSFQSMKAALLNPMKSLRNE